MRLKIHDGSPHEDGVVYLRLIETEPNHVALAAVGQGGESLLDPDNWAHGGTLLTVTAEGRLALSPAVMPALGFNIDTGGRIQLDPWVESKNAQRAQEFGGKRASFRAVK